MNLFTSIRALPPLSAYLKQQTLRLLQALDNIKIEDVQSDEHCERMRLFIESAVMPKLVKLGEPVFSTSSSNPEAAILNKIRHKFRGTPLYHVSIPFYGSRELLEHAPGGQPMDPDSKILIPELNALEVKLSSAYAHREDALEAAQTLLRPTTELISRNNHQVLHWIEQAELRIRHKLSNRRKEYLDLYHPNGLLSITTDI